MPNTSLHISLSDKLKEDVYKQVAEGEYSTATDYVRHLIRRDLLRKKAKREFAEYIKQGMTSPSINQTPGEMIAELKSEINRDT